MRNPNLYLLAGVIFAIITILLVSPNSNTKESMIVNISYGYISSCIVYALTVTLKNKMDRKRFMWQIYDMINELYAKIQELSNDSLDDKLILNSDGDYQLYYDDLCKLRKIVDGIKYEVECVEKIYYNLLKHSECEAFVIISNAINNLRKKLCECVIFDKDEMCEVKNSPAIFHKTEIDFIKGYISALVENVSILQASIIKEIDKK